MAVVSLSKGICGAVLQKNNARMKKGARCRVSVSCHSESRSCGIESLT
jgi:hypothetical protein